MKQTIIATALLISLVVAGCNKKASSSIPNDSSVTDISPPPAQPYQSGSGYQPAAQQPVVSDSMQNSSGGYGSSGAMAGGSYTVKRGDTLYSIARTRYGDGKQWQRIAAANPGLEPSKLRVGQTITVP